MKDQIEAGRVKLHHSNQRHRTTSIAINMERPKKQNQKKEA